MRSLERRYRLLLHAYPDTYRAGHEDEMVATLLDASEPEQIDPSVRESVGLLVNGLRTRARLAAEGGWRGLGWDAVRLAALLLLGSLLANTAFWIGAPSLTRMRMVPVLVLVALVATIRGATRVAVAALVVAAALGWMFLLPLWMVPGFPVGGYFEYNVAALVAAVVALVAYSMRRGHRRPWPWWVAAAAALALVPFAIWSPAQLMSLASGVVGFHLPLSLLMLGVPVVVLTCASLLGNDPRPSIAATLYAAVNLGALAASATAFGLGTPTLLIVLLATTAITLATGTLSGRRLIHTRM